jgi:hypothetical protein
VIKIYISLLIIILKKKQKISGTFETSFSGKFQIPNEETGKEFIQMYSICNIAK